jgi:hypothetical protein
VLAPVLARLRRLPGITDARVECSGTFFALSLADGAEAEAVLPMVVDVLGSRSRLLAAEEAGAQLEARSRGELWFSEEQIRGLSYVEGRIIASRALSAAADGLTMGEQDAAKIREAVRAEVFAAIDRVHDEGGRRSSAWFAEEWPRIVARARDRLADALPEPTLTDITARLRRLH